MFLSIIRLHFLHFISLPQRPTSSLSTEGMSSKSILRRRTSRQSIHRSLHILARTERPLHSTSKPLFSSLDLFRILFFIPLRFSIIAPQLLSLSFLAISVNQLLHEKPFCSFLVWEYFFHKSFGCFQPELRKLLDLPFCLVSSVNMVSSLELRRSTLSYPSLQSRSSGSRQKMPNSLPLAQHLFLRLL